MPPPGKKPQRPNRPEGAGKGGRPSVNRPRGKAPVAPGLLRVRRVDGNRYALLPPACAFEREEDLDEVRKMIAGGEPEIARDELLYLVADCRGFLEAHNLLGQLALEDEDIALARGHFGFAYEIALQSLGSAFQGILPAGREYNREFFLAGRGVARCLISRGKREEGREILKKMAKFDPREPDVKALLDELDEQDRTGNLPPVVPLVDEDDDDDSDDE